MVLQPCANRGMRQVAFAVQLLFAGTLLLVIEVKALTLDSFEFVYLCSKSVYVSHNAGISEVIDCVIDDEATGATRVENAMISVLGARTVEVGGRECSCVKGGPKNWFAFALHTFDGLLHR